MTEPSGKHTECLTRVFSISAEPLHPASSFPSLSGSPIVRDICCFHHPAFTPFAGSSVSFWRTSPSQGMWSGWVCQSALPTPANLSNYYLDIRTVHYIQPLLFLEAFLDHCAFHPPPLLNFYKVRVHVVQTSSKCPFYLSWANQTLSPGFLVPSRVTSSEARTFVAESWWQCPPGLWNCWGLCPLHSLFTQPCW